MIRMIHKSLTYLAAAFSTLCIFWAIGFLWFLITVVTVEVPPAAQKTDAIIVLTGGEGRVDEGIALLRQKASPRLFISGVNPQVKPRDLAKGGEKLPCCVTLGYEAADTKGNADETAAWVRRNNIGSIRLVTSSYHIPRALLEFSYMIPDVIILSHPVKARGQDKIMEKPLWIITFKEYNKTLLVWIRQTMAAGERV